MLKKLLQTAGGLAMALAMIVSLNTAALAAGGVIDLDRTGAITVTPQTGDGTAAVAQGTEFTLYQVGSVINDDGTLSFSLTDPFSASGADLSDLEAEGLAQTLADYASEQKLTGETATADQDGTVLFTGLPLGLYLLVQTGVTEGSYTVSPFLVTVPTSDEGGYLYEVDASPKAEVYKLTEVTVKKVWNDGNSSSRPSSVTVSLYRGEERVGVTTLNEENDWTYTWEGLEQSDEYRVEESAVSGYVAKYTQSGNTFTVTNTGDTTKTPPNKTKKTSTTTTTKTTATKLAQTGQLNWPIPLLAGCGVALFAAGWALAFLRRKEN